VNRRARPADDAFPHTWQRRGPGRAIIVTLDTRGRVLTINESGARALKRSAARMRNASWFSLCVHPADRAQARRAFTACVAGRGSAFEFLRYRVKPARGAPRLIAWHASRLTARGGRVVLCTGRDITEEQQALDDLATSARKFETLFASAPDAIFLETLHGAIIDCNPAASALLGYSRTELLKMHARDLVPPDIARMFPRLIRKELTTGGAFVEARNIRKNGEIFPVAVSTKLIDIRGVRYAFVVVQDITERKRAGQQLKEYTENLEHIVAGRIKYEHLVSDISNDALVNRNVNAFISRALRRIGTVLGISRAYLFRYAPDTRTLTNTHEWCNRGITPFITELHDLPVDMFPRWHQTMARNTIVNESDTRRVQDRWVRTLLLKQGVRSVLCVPLALKDAYYGFIGFDECASHRRWLREDVRLLKTIGQIIVQAIERAAAERSLRYLNELQEGIITNTPQAICVLDSSLRIITANTGFARTFPDQAGRLTGQTLCQAIACTEPVARCPLACAIERIARGGPSCEFETQLTLSNGQRRHIIFFSSSITASSGRRILVVIHDITPQKQMQNQLILSEKLASAGRLVASIAHEINNPLQGITTHLDILKDSLPDRYSERESYTHVRSNIDKISLTVRRLLDLYRVPEPDQGVLELNELLSSTIALVRNKIRMKNIAVRLSTAKNLPPITGSRHSLQQVFLNLLLNAIDSTQPRGAITITSRRRGDRQEITFTDTGTGIAPVDLPNIFEPFFTTKSQHGTGLGLYVSNEIIKGHNGEILVASTPGRGSTFTVTLPA